MIQDSTINLDRNKKKELSQKLLFTGISHRNNMLVIRYYLCLCVLLAHCSVLTGIDFPWIQRGTVDVGCFFAISGFLMFPSFEKRKNIWQYLRRRALRIMPSYLFIILFCTIVLVTVSSLSYKEYFSSSELYRYLAANISCLNFIQTDLPGVFQGDQFYISAVNGSLWTMKGEWICYLSVPVVYWFIERQQSIAGITIVSILLICLFFKIFLLEFFDGKSLINVILAKQIGTIIIFFYIGALINLYFKQFLKYKWFILAFDIIILIFVDYIPNDIYYYILQPIVTGSLVIWLSMLGFWGAFLSKHDGISYEIYLYHFPIIQLAVYFGLPKTMDPMLMLLIVLTTTVLLAYITRRFIGRKFNSIHR